MPTEFNRRDLIARTAVASAAACLVDATTTTAHGTEQVSDAKAAKTRSTTKAVVEWPIWDSREETALLEVLNSGKWGRTSGGRRLAAFEAAFAERMRARYCIATASGTTALLTTLGALGIGPGDEVILPPYRSWPP